MVKLKGKRNIFLPGGEERMLNEMQKRQKRRKGTEPKIASKNYNTI
jgi:hypothetical protein